MVMRNIQIEFRRGSCHYKPGLFSLYVLFSQYSGSCDYTLGDCFFQISPGLRQKVNKSYP